MENENKTIAIKKQTILCLVAICLSILCVILSVAALVKKPNVETQTIEVQEAEYDIKLDLTNCESIYVMPTSGSGFYVKEFYIKNQTCWYKKQNGEVYYKLLSSVMVSVIYKENKQ